MHQLACSSKELEMLRFLSGTSHWKDIFKFTGSNPGSHTYTYICKTFSVEYYLLDYG